MILSPFSVLVVEQDPERLDATVQLVEQLGFRGARAGDSAAALRWLGERTFAAVLVRWPLPSPGGPELARWIRGRDEDTRDTRVLLVLDPAAAEAAEGCFDVGADEILARPRVAPRLAACLESWILDAATVATMRELEIATQLYTAFVQELPALMATLRSALAAADRPAVRRLAHRLRGSSVQMGARALALALREIEDAAATGEGRGTLAEAELDELVQATTVAVTQVLAGLD